MMVNMGISKIAWLICLALILGPIPSQAFSGKGTVTVAGGRTLVRFAPQFFNLFPALGGTMKKYGKARLKGSLNRQNIRIRFPLSAATLTPVRENLPFGFMDFEHQGGLLLENGGRNLTVLMNSPTIRESNRCWASTECLEFGAVLLANGTVVRTVDNFAQSAYGIDSFKINQSNEVVIRNVPMALTWAGAELINQFFGLVPGGGLYLGEGTPFATLDIIGHNAKVLCPAGSRYVRKYQQCG